MKPADALRKGCKLKLPGGSTPEAAEAKAPAAAAPERPSYHAVQRGDTLSGLAARYGMSVAELRRLNGMGKDAVLRAGMKLKLM